ncbi:hypothetical protein V6N11_035470 [Hibiscus sabdariffa]|uniref:Ubiquitin conjugation factor E4 core domain-containing protein n=1 Tax=Hibiscus sabdariffa TaxID=183260 RepID=A0ABR2R0H3_9ROSI
MIEVLEHLSAVLLRLDEQMTCYLHSPQSRLSRSRILDTMSWPMFFSVTLGTLRLVTVSLSILQKSSIQTHQGPIYSLCLQHYSFGFEVRGLTALHATSEEVAEWIDIVNPVKTDGSGLNRDGESGLRQMQEASSSGSAFNVKVLNLGLLKAFSDFKHLDIPRSEDTLDTLKAMQGQTPSPQLELEISRLEKEIELYSQEKFCYEAQILRVYLISSTLSVSAYVAPIL